MGRKVINDQTTKKLPCNECHSTYLDANKERRCEKHRGRTDGQSAEETCMEQGFYYSRGESKDAKPDRTASFDIFGQ